VLELLSTAPEPHRRNLSSRFKPPTQVILDVFHEAKTNQARMIAARARKGFKIEPDVATALELPSDPDERKELLEGEFLVCAYEAWTEITTKSPHVPLPLLFEPAVVETKSLVNKSRTLNSSGSKKYGSTVSLDKVGERLLMSGESVEEFVITQEAARHMMQSAGLSERERLVLTLDVDKYTDAEIGASLKIAPATVRATLHHARQKLENARRAG